MDRKRAEYYFQQPDQRISIGGTIVYAVVVLYAIHYVLIYFDFAILPPQEILWNAIVYLTPKRLLLDRARRHELKANDMLSQTHAAKSDALRRMVGFGGNAVIQNLSGAGESGIMRRASMLAGIRPQPTGDAPAGLGNWDNSCYQNSVLQGLAALDSLKPFLRRSEDAQCSTSESLLGLINKLNDASNNGRQLWTPAKLKNMSSWQQQDAQEYFSKIMDELDKETAQSLSTSQTKEGLESIANPRNEPMLSSDISFEPRKEGETTSGHRNPLDGLIAQRVICTRCNFSEGLSMIPFNCLTLPLGSDFAYDVEECLDEYTKLEEISDVECGKCTLLKAEEQLEQMLPRRPSLHSVDDAAAQTDAKTVMQLPPELRAQAFKRLRAIQQALEEDDVTDKTLNEACQISKKARISSTKTKQAVIARAPQCLVVHVNRSVFDETTGVQRKNYSKVRYPGELDLAGWMLSGSSSGSEMLDASGRVEEPVNYRLKAVVTHYGRHENGHYICYRQHPVIVQSDAVEDLDADDENAVAPEDLDEQPKVEMQWWRLSDEDVSRISEDDVLQQGGVFMLFYERDGLPEKPLPVATSDVPVEVQQSITLDPEAIHVAGDADPTPGAPLDSKDSADADPRTIDAPCEEAPATPLSLTEASSESYPSSPLEAPSTEATTEDESEAEMSPSHDTQPTTKSPATPLMRTARGRPSTSPDKRFGGGNVFRPVAAT